MTRGLKGSMPESPKSKDNLRRTKCFSYGPGKERFWRALEREARIERRSLSAQMFFILEDFFERKKMLQRVQRNEGGEDPAT